MTDTAPPAIRSATATPEMVKAAYKKYGSEDIFALECDDWMEAVINAALAMQPRSVVLTENDGLTKAMEIVGNMRQSDAGRFDDPKYCGQRGCDRANALYDAYVAIRAALPSTVPSTDRKEMT